jgi:hypothetical protein
MQQPTAKPSQGALTPALGVLMLDTRFPRIPGDVGNPQSYPFPIVMRVVPGATVARVLNGGAPECLDAFVDAARALESQGVVAITSSCGFLSPVQTQVAAAVRVPVFLSALFQAPMVHALTGGRIGILTANRASLTDQVLTAARIGPAIPVAIAGLEHSPAFRAAILSDGAELDRDRVEQDVAAAARALVAHHPDIAALVLECHNLAPYGPALRAATGRPIWDVITLAQWVYDALVKQVFAR